MSIKLSVLRTLQLAVQPESSSSDKSFDIKVNTKSVICDMEGGGHNVSVQGVFVTLQHLQPHHSILVRLLQRGGCLLALPPGG